MSLVNTKFTTKSLQIITNLALIVAFLSHFAAPLVVEADMADSSQNSAIPEQTISQGPNLMGMDKLVKKDIPDKRVKAVITAYTSTPGQTDDTPFIAASGKRVHDGMIAANGLPFGTKIKIPAVYGDKIFIVEDRMNSRYGYGRFDVWLDTTRAEARKFGVKRVEVEIFYPEKAVAKK